MKAPSDSFLKPLNGRVFMTKDGPVDMGDAITAARYGKPEVLAERLETGIATAEELAYAAAVLRGEIKRPAHRPASAEAAARRYDLAVYIAVLELVAECKREAVVAEAMREFGVGRKQCYAALAEVERDPVAGPRFKAHNELYVAAWKMTARSRQMEAEIAEAWPEVET